MAEGIEELRAKAEAARQEKSELQAKVDEAAQAVQELDASVAEHGASAPAPVDGKAGMSLDALQAEVAELEAQVQAKQRETRLGAAGAGMSDEQLREEYMATQRTLAACQRRQAKLNDTLSQLGDPKKILQRQEAVQAKKTQVASLEADIKAQERLIKKLETQLSAAAAAREREADSATSEVRKLQAEVARLTKLAEMAEADVESTQRAIEAAKAELALRERMAERMAEGIKREVGDVRAVLAPAAPEQLVDEQPPGPATTTSSPRPHKHDDVVTDVSRLQKKHAKLQSELQKRRKLLEAEKAKLVKVQSRTANVLGGGVVSASPPAAGHMPASRSHAPPPGTGLPLDAPPADPAQDSAPHEVVAL
mmetsp:Transcript_14944/g.45697  ORF Transcript_14944/g.45697 Transcript_14944/m.45697 type:complete len:366 (-) Transcript_14944:201-1298(-)